jgi:small-conductance mechanosensitive channel
VTEFLQSNLWLVVGALLALLLIGIRSASVDKTFRKDLHGAVVLLVGHVLVRMLGWGLYRYVPPGTSKAFRVVWMLMLAFGLIRALVSFGLLAIRFRSTTPIPKILRDVFDFTLYSLAALFILKGQLDIDLSGLLATSAILSVVIGLALQDTLGTCSPACPSSSSARSRWGTS